MVVKNIVSIRVTFMSSICHHQMSFVTNIVMLVGCTIYRLGYMHCPEAEVLDVIRPKVLRVLLAIHSHLY